MGHLQKSDPPNSDPSDGRWYVIDADTCWGKPDVWWCRAVDSADALRQAWNVLPKYGSTPKSAKYDENHIENRSRTPR